MDAKFFNLLENNENINLLKDRLDFYHDLPSGKKNNFINIIKNDYNGYDNLIELFPKIKNKNIEKYVHLIEGKLNKGSNRHEIKNYYTVHSGLIDFLLDSLGIIDKENDIIPTTFEWKNNQLRGIDISVNSDFTTGIHSQATGSGKSLMALNIMWKYHTKYPKDNLMWLCERKDIPQKLFFNITTDGKNKVINNKTDTYKFWKDNNIIDMGSFIIKEYVYNKDKNWIEDINKKYNKPLFIIINRAFLTTASNKRGKKYKFEGITNIPKFIILDECHSATANRTYELLCHCKYVWGSKIHGLSATPYRKGKSFTEFKTTIYPNDDDVKLDTTFNIEKLKNIFSKPYNNNELNILSWFNLKDAIETECILEPVFHWYNMNEYQKKNNVEYDKKEIHSILTVLNDIISSTTKNTYYNMRYKKIIVWCRLIDIAKHWFTVFKKNKNLYHNLSNLNMFIDYSGVETDFPLDININEGKGYYYDEFYDSPNNSIMFCAAKFREGSDIPFLSCAVFLDKVKNRGDVPFIQCIGRVLRKETDKNCGHIIDGYVVTEDKTNTKNIVDKLLKYYIDLYEISKSDFIIENDNNEDIKLLSKRKIDLYNDIVNGLDIQPEEKKIYIKIKNNKKITINLGNIKLKTIKWNAITSDFNDLMKTTIIFSDYDEYMYLKKKANEIGISDKKEYLEKVQESKVFNDVNNPDEKYKDYWTNWYDFLGIDTKNFIQSKEKWIKYCKKKKVMTLDEYYNLCNINSSLPTMPEEYYDKFTDIIGELGLRQRVVY